LEYGVLTVAGICTTKIVWFYTSTTKLRIRENFILVLPVNILTGVERRLLGPHNTRATVCLDTVVLLAPLMVVVIEKAIYEATSVKQSYSF